MPEDQRDIETHDQLLQFMRDNMGTLLQENPEVVFQALAQNEEGFQRALETAGFTVAERNVMDPQDVVGGLRMARQDRLIDTGFGASIRKRCDSVRYVHPVTGKARRTFITSHDQEDLAYRWIVAFFSRNWKHPQTGEDILDIREKLERGVRAPSDPLLGDIGEAGAGMVPTVIAAEIFELMNEAFPLKGMVQTFTSATPLEVNRRTVEVTVNRGGSATDIDEDKPELGPVRLSPERVAVLTYVDPKLARASAQGPVRWVLEQIAEAMEKDDQRVIVAGNPGQREPRGILNLPTSGGNSWDRANTNAYDNSSVKTERASMETAYYAVPQKHRQSGSFAWIANSDGVRELFSHNDQDKKPFDDEGERERYLRKTLVETTALSTSGSATTILGGDMDQYAWLESPQGLELEQTREGGEAWESATIGVRAIQYVDGAPIVPGAYSIVTSVDV